MYLGLFGNWQAANTQQWENEESNAFSKNTTFKKKKNQIMSYSNRIFRKIF